MNIFLKDLFLIQWRNITPRGTLKSFLYLCLLALPLFVLHHHLLLPSLVKYNQHVVSSQSLLIAATAEFCQKPSSISRKYYWPIIKGLNQQLDLSLKKQIETRAGSIGAYCNTAEFVCQNENSLMLLMRFFLWLNPEISMAQLGYCLLLVKIFVIVSFCYLLIRLNVGLIFCFLVASIALDILEVMLWVYYSTYPFIFLLIIFNVTILTLGILNKIHKSLSKNIIFSLFVGIIAGFCSNMRTSETLIYVCLYLCYLIVVVGQTIQLTGFASWGKKTVWVTTGVAYFAVGFMVFFWVFISPLTSPTTAHGQLNSKYFSYYSLNKAYFQNWFSPRTLTLPIIPNGQTYLNFISDYYLYQVYFRHWIFVWPFNTLVITQRHSELKSFRDYFLNQSYTRHVVGHSLALALGEIPNTLAEREGIKIHDIVGLKIARKIDRDVEFLGPGYDEALLTYYMRLWRDHPKEMLSIYLAKMKWVGVIAIDHFVHRAYQGRMFLRSLFPLVLIRSGYVFLAVFVALLALFIFRLRSPLGFMLSLLAVAGILVFMESTLIVSKFDVCYQNYLLFWLLFVSLLIYQTVFQFAGYLTFRFARREKWVTDASSSNSSFRGNRPHGDEDGRE